MFKKWFTKYARAVSDDRERAWLYKKYHTKTVVSILFYTLCILVIVLAFFLNPYIEQEWALAVMSVVILSWIGFAIANFCLWISFKSTYNSILRRPAYSGEIPEVTAYRQKVAEDKKSTFKSLWWAWVIFGIGVVGFIACMVMAIRQNPDGEEVGRWGTVSVYVLLAGSLTLALAYIIHSSVKQQQGKTVEQQTEREASKIDVVQGRKHVYKLQADPNLQTYKYLFPNEQLYAEAEKIRKKYTKIFTVGVILFTGIAVIIAILLSSSESIFGKNIAGYALPVAFTAFSLSVLLFALPLNGKLNAVEKKQKAELERNPEYAKNLAWYRLYENFQKFKGKIYLLFIAVGIVLGWVLAILFPSSSWSFLMLVPMFVGLIMHNELVKDLRQKAIPIEREIDEEQRLLHDVRFTVQEGAPDENMRIRYDGESLIWEGAECGGVALYLGETYFCMEVDGETRRVVNFSSERTSIAEAIRDRIPTPQNALAGNLFAELTEKLANGTCWRIYFEGGERYDPESKNLLIGTISDELPVYRIFKNCFVQRSNDGVLCGVLCTEIGEKKDREGIENVAL